MADLDIDSIRARRAAATEGAWRINMSDRAEVWADRDPAGWDAFMVAQTKTRLNPIADDQALADAEFIAHAPGDIAALLADADRLRAQVQRVEALTGGPFSAGYQPYAVEIDGDVILTVDLDDLRAALDGSQ